jgi:hypothetical protein
MMASNLPLNSAGIRLCVWIVGFDALVGLWRGRIGLISLTLFFSSREIVESGGIGGGTWGSPPTGQERRSDIPGESQDFVNSKMS